MRILFLNNDGGGYADYQEAKDGLTVQQFLEGAIESFNPARYLIRVNRHPVASDTVLQDGDRVTATPTKIDGA